MNKKDSTEIKRRLKIDKTTITRLAGCYVDEKKEKITTFSAHFMDLEDEEAHKYLEITNKALSGTPGNNLLELPFPTDEELDGGLQQSLLALRDSHLENEHLLDAFYDHVIDTYDTVDHYLILLFYDTYDIPMKTSDNMLLDDSEEIYENRIAPRIRDWVVGAVESAFTFPCFSERSTDIHNVLVYTKDAKEPHVEFWEDGLGAKSKPTSTQKRNGFLGLIAKSVGEENEETPDILLDVQQNMHDYMEEKEEVRGDDEPILLSKQDMAGILEASYEEMFPEDATAAEELYETRALKDNALRHEKKILQEKVVELNDELLRLGLVNEDGEIIDIAVRTRPGRENHIETTYVDGRKCIVIPLEENDTATVNGETISTLR